MARYVLSDNCPCAFELFPVSERLARKYKRESGHESVLFQVDWDYPSLAQTLGWMFRSPKCNHCHTDGTIDCPECGKTASQFIEEAHEYLNANVGRHFNDPYGGIAAYFRW